MTPLDVALIRAPIDESLQSRLDQLEVFPEIESTNSYLMQQSPPPAGRFRVVLAEHQTAGRGLRERRWLSPRNSGVCLSMAYTFSATPPKPACVTLAIGVAVARTLEGLGVRGVGLKWPNDIVVRDGKLGGILTETVSRPGREATVVVGVGINVDLRNAPDVRSIATRIGYVSDLASAMRDVPSRSAISAALIESLFNTLAEFEADGFEPFLESWDRYDWLRGQRVSIDVPEGHANGTCEGVDHDGALILRTANGRRRILSGSVHLFRQKDPR